MDANVRLSCKGKTQSFKISREVTAKADYPASQDQERTSNPFPYNQISSNPGIQI